MRGLVWPIWARLVARGCELGSGVWIDGRDCLGTKTVALCIDGAPWRDFRLQGLMLSSLPGWFRYRQYYGRKPVLTAKSHPGVWALSDVAAVLL